MQDGCLRWCTQCPTNNTVREGFVACSDETCLRRTIATTHHPTSFEVPRWEVGHPSQVGHRHCFLGGLFLLFHSGRVTATKKLWTVWRNMIGWESSFSFGLMGFLEYWNPYKYGISDKWSYNKKRLTVFYLFCSFGVRKYTIFSSSKSSKQFRKSNCFLFILFIWS